MILEESDIWHILETKCDLETVAFPVGPIKGEPETIVFRLRDSDGEVIEVEQKLISRDSERTQLDGIVISDSLKDRGIEGVWVKLTREAPLSEIYLKIKDIPQPLKITKNYY